MKAKLFGDIAVHDHPLGNDSAAMDTSIGPFVDVGSSVPLFSHAETEEFESMINTPFGSTPEIDTGLFLGTPSPIKVSSLSLLFYLNSTIETKSNLGTFR